MLTSLARVTILVKDQDEALNFYTNQLGLEVRSDQVFGPGARWLTLGVPGQDDIEIVLQEPDPALHGDERAEEMQQQIGRQPTWVFFCDDCQGTYEALKARGVAFLNPPKQQMYGIEAVFSDLYGNTFSLLQPAPMTADAAADFATANF